MTADAATGSDEGNGRRSLAEIVEAAQNCKAEDGQVRVGDLVQSLGRASHAAMLLLPAILAASPLSGIPGLSAFCGTIIALVAVQMLLGRRHLWLPDWVLRRKVDRDRLNAALDKVRPVAAFLDRHTRRRLTVFVRRPGIWVLYLMCLAGGLVMPVLELVPFSASIVAGTIAFFAVAILTLDGLMVALGACFLAAIGSLVLWLI